MIENKELTLENYQDATEEELRAFLTSKEVMIDEATDPREAVKVYLEGKPDEENGKPAMPSAPEGSEGGERADQVPEGDQPAAPAADDAPAASPEDTENRGDEPQPDPLPEGALTDSVDVFDKDGNFSRRFSASEDGENWKRDAQNHAANIGGGEVRATVKEDAQA